MSTYRVGDHHGVTIVREGDGARCGRPGHDCDRGHLVGVMLTAEDAELAVEALNEHERLAELRRDVMEQLMPPQPAYSEPSVEDWDSCTCPFLSGRDPACPVHQGRRARGRRSWGTTHAHPTCIDVSNERAGRPPGTEWMCGPDCPPWPERDAL